MAARRTCTQLKRMIGLAPAHILTAEYDMLRDSGEAYARRLAEAGVETTLHRLLGLTHGAPVLRQEWEPARAWMDEVVRVLARALHVSLDCPQRPPCGATAASL
jgi:acetyl esterase/lipase